jgi:hypothetical protein
MTDITPLERIEARLAEIGMAPSRASKLSGNSRDLIRNWQRARDEGRGFPGKLEHLSALAGVLGVPIEWLSGGLEVAGLAEDASPFLPREIPGGSSLERYLAPDTDACLSWRTNTAAPSLGILAGDLLIIDMKGTPAPGETVVAAVLIGDTVETRIARFAPPWLILPNATEAPIPLDRARVQGAVVALARGPGILPKDNGIA